MRIAFNFSGDFLNSGATASLKAGCRERNVLETRRDNGNGTITIVAMRSRRNNRKLPRVIDRSIQLAWRFQAFARREIRERKQQWDNARDNGRASRIIRNGVHRNEERVARDWKSMKNCLPMEESLVERNFDDECETKARLTIKICNYRGTFIIDLSKHLVGRTVLLSDHILLSDYILLLEKYFSVRSVFTYIYTYIYVYMHTRALSLFPLDKRIFIWIYLFEMSQ